ncbi:MAG: hypothetical protein JWM87_1720 [Candidatus Eremiobacteraeota bacterium]|nr:hypothetical protein [Candidatus Eremiobacteraeota bacterium]
MDDRTTRAGAQPLPADDPPRSPGNAIIIVLFAIVLLVPAALALAGHARPDEDFIYHNEMRHAFTAPPVNTGALATGGWERDVERQIADAFPFRTSFIKGYDVAKYRWLDDVASPHVIRGSNGWIFYGDEERDYQDGTYHPGDAQLTRLAGLYKDRADWCARRGIAYVFALVPDKSAVYARFVPDSVRYVAPTPGERLISRMRAGGVRAIDLRTVLRAAAAHDEVYSKGDTHWNDVGAYEAYRAIVRELHGAGVRDTIVPASLQRRIAVEDGDLDRLAGITPAVRNDVIVYDFPARARKLAPPVYPRDAKQGAFIREAYATGDPRLPKAMLFGDSFTGMLRRFLAEDFSRMVVMQHSIENGLQFDRSAIEAERPAVVVEELVERALVNSNLFEP